MKPQLRAIIVNNDSRRGPLGSTLEPSKEYREGPIQREGVIGGGNDGQIHRREHDDWLP
jgi:hypothetical protein